MITHEAAVTLEQSPERTFDFRFRPRDGGRRVEVSMRLQPSGGMRLIEPLSRRMVPRMLADLPENTRRGIEAADRVRQDASVA